MAGPATNGTVVWPVPNPEAAAPVPQDLAATWVPKCSPHGDTVAGAVSAQCPPGFLE
jgi:hypothetical protein